MHIICHAPISNCLSYGRARFERYAHIYVYILSRQLYDNHKYLSLRSHANLQAVNILTSLRLFFSTIISFYDCWKRCLKLPIKWALDVACFSLILFNCNFDCLKQTICNGRSSWRISCKYYKIL